MPPRQQTTSPLEIFAIYLRLGCISFGGPVAHMGYFRDEFVGRRAWLDDARYAELLGLCQFVPGPSSSQLGFAIGWHRGGLPGAGAAWLGFTLPSAALMAGLAYGLFAFSGNNEPLVQGLLIAAVAVVVKAILGLGNKLCPDLPRLAIALLAAVITLHLPGSLPQIAAITLGVLAGQLLPTRVPGTPRHATGAHLSAPHRIAITSLAVYAILLVASLLMPGDLYALHYRAGALVFGGGHVVLPLLHEGIVAGNAVDRAVFLTGYSAAQAMPGPLFTLSAFMGTVGGATQPAILGGLAALVAIFLPGMLLLIGLLPFWERIRDLRSVQAGLIGANAAVVGLLLAALIDPVWTHGIRSFAEFGIGLAAFLALHRFKAPASAVVISCGLAGCLFL